MKATLENIQKVVRENRLISDRIEKLLKMGYKIEKRKMGSGGVMQIKNVGNEIRIQISCGKGRYNYAYAVIINK